MATHKAYDSTTESKLVWIKTKLLFYPGQIHLMFKCLLRLSVDAAVLVPKFHANFTKGPHKMRPWGQFW